jgi:gustatory receptor
VEFITFFSYQILVHFLCVLAIVYVSSAASKESEKTATCVHKLLNVTNIETLRTQLTQLSMQLLHRKVRFTACSLFNLDIKLIFTVCLLTNYYITSTKFCFTNRLSKLYQRTSSFLFSSPSTKMKKSRRLGKTWGNY